VRGHQTHRPGLEFRIDLLRHGLASFQLSRTRPASPSSRQRRHLQDRWSPVTDRPRGATDPTPTGSVPSRQPSNALTC
jgi:hypothetical protein